MGQQAPVWSFARGTDRLAISREAVDDGMMLIVAGDGAPRSYFFREIPRLEVFQRDMETLLLKTGWSFVSFAPEKRGRRDRRGWPRKSDDRRRWWTDGSTGSNAAAAAKADTSRKPRTEDAALTPNGTEPLKFK